MSDRRRSIIQAEKLDTEIVILRRTVAQEDVYGTSDETWFDHDTVWADVQDMLPSRAERIGEGINIARRPCRIRLRWRDDITADMRIRIGSRELRIVTMPAELGRREGIELVAEELTTEGQEP